MKAIDSEELIATLHNTAFKDGDDREIVYGIIDRMANEDVISDTMMKLEAENRELKAMAESLDKDRYNAHRTAELRYKDGVIEGLKFAIRFYMAGDSR